MSLHGKKLRNGVRELIHTKGTTLEDMHIVATDIVTLIDKMSASTARKLKRGQEIRIYDDKSYKEYGQKGSDKNVYVHEIYSTKLKGTLIKVYKNTHKWSIPLYCLLESFDIFDPESEEGKKLLKKVNIKKRGRKSKAYKDNKEQYSLGSDYITSLDREGSSSNVIAGVKEDYDFNNYSNWESFYDND